MKPASPVAMFLAFANKLKFRNLFLVITGLFLIDLIVPDFIPLIDEIILGLLAIMLANWKKEHIGEMSKGNVMQREIVNLDDKEK